MTADHTGPAALPGALTGDLDLLERLQRWAAEGQVAEAARARRTEHWLTHQAAEQATLAGALLDLAERGRPILLATGPGRRHRAWISGIGVDFVSVVSEQGRQMLVTLGSVTTVRPLAGDRSALSGRTTAFTMTLVDALDSVVGERPRVQVTGRSGEPRVAGVLTAVGIDLIELALDGDERSSALVPTHAIAEVLLL